MSDCINRFTHIELVLHTEVQLQALINAKKIELDPEIPIVSYKLPCWSCIRLPFLKDINSVKYVYSIDRGLNDEELSRYPVTVRTKNMQNGGNNITLYFIHN